MEISKQINRKIDKEKSTLTERLEDYRDRQRGFFEFTRVYKFLAQPVTVKDSVGIVFYALVFAFIGLAFYNQVNTLNQDVDSVVAKQNSTSELD